jgi:hypothetical protein
MVESVLFSALGWLLEKTLEVSESGGSFGSEKTMIASQVLQRAEVSNREAPRQATKNKESGSMLACVTQALAPTRNMVDIGHVYMCSTH